MAKIVIDDGLPYTEVTPRAKGKSLTIGGGEEAVVKKQVEAIEVGDLIASPFSIQMGALQYGFDFVLDDILGFDFLRQVKAQLDFDTMEIQKK